MSSLQTYKLYHWYQLWKTLFAAKLSWDINYRENRIEILAVQEHKRKDTSFVNCSSLIIQFHNKLIFCKTCCNQYFFPNSNAIVNLLALLFYSMPYFILAISTSISLTISAIVTWNTSGTFIGSFITIKNYYHKILTSSQISLIYIVSNNFLVVIYLILLACHLFMNLVYTQCLSLDTRRIESFDLFYIFIATKL